MILDPDNDVYLSAVSAWEIARKCLVGKLKLDGPASTVVRESREAAGIESLALTEEDALTAEKLALVHKDPFDRMLIGQAIMQGMTILTPDAVFREYPVRVVW